MLILILISPLACPGLRLSLQTSDSCHHRCHRHCCYTLWWKFAMPNWDVLSSSFFSLNKRQAEKKSRCWDTKQSNPQTTQDWTCDTRLHLYCFSVCFSIHPRSYNTPLLATVVILCYRVFFFFFKGRVQLISQEATAPNTLLAPSVTGDIFHTRVDAGHLLLQLFRAWNDFQVLPPSRPYSCVMHRGDRCSWGILTLPPSLGGRLSRRGWH